jgi:hypothetical protein
MSNNIATLAPANLRQHTVARTSKSGTVSLHRLTCKAFGDQNPQLKGKALQQAYNAYKEEISQAARSFAQSELSRRVFSSVSESPTGVMTIKCEKPRSEADILQAQIAALQKKLADAQAAANTIEA